MKGLIHIEHHLSTSYSLPLVLFSIVVAIFSASVALDISSRLKYSKNVSQFRWIFTGAFVLGLGIWAMHFIGMLAFHMDIHVTYHIGLVILSILPAVASSGIAFYMISRKNSSKLHLLVAAFFISIGIICMHYSGMGAMQMGATISYNPFMWGLSAVVAFIASYIGLLLLYTLPNVPRFHWRKWVSAILIGLAVSGMHYIGMAAADFSAIDSEMKHDDLYALDSTLLAYVIGGSMLMLLTLALVAIRNDRQLELQSEESEMRFQSIIEAANDAIIVADFQGHIIQWNQGAENLFGYSHEEIIGEKIATIIPERFQEAHKRGMKRYQDTGATHVIGNTVELVGRRKDGSEFPLEMSLGSWETEKGIFFSSIIRDITERKCTEAKINDLVYLDPLTGLPNRRLFHDRMDSLLQQSEESRQPFSLFYIDFDNFKMVNDRFGHSMGDLFLKSLTERLGSHVYKNETLSRLGGDEFVILLPNTSYSQAAHRAQDMIDAMSDSFLIEKEEIFTSMSIGISLYPTDGNNAEDLIKNADIAMYRAKEDGKNGYQFFTSDMNEIVSRKSMLAIALRKGIERGEFSVHYQPQINLVSEKIIGVEALLRWNHPNLGAISPAEFIPIAEETGSIHRIGEFVLTEACRQNKAWQNADIPPFRVAVNISALQFAQKDITQIVSQTLQTTGLAPEYLELELTETIIQHAKSAIETMKELSSLGVHLSIDDFGTGYSSLSYLKLFPIDTLKIDQHFTRNIETDSKDAALVKTIIRLAHDLDLNVIAEGVETKDQVEFLKTEQCNQAQGYYFNRPLPANELETFYHEYKQALNM